MVLVSILLGNTLTPAELSDPVGIMGPRLNLEARIKDIIKTQSLKKWSLV